MKFSLEQLKTLPELLRQLSSGLNKLDLIDNFSSFEEKEIVITSGSESKIRNQLKNIPTRYMITNQIGNGLVTRATTTWTLDNLFLINNGPATVTINIIFMR